MSSKNYLQWPRPPLRCRINSKIISSYNVGERQDTTNEIKIFWIEATLLAILSLITVLAMFHYRWTCSILQSPTKEKCLFDMENIEKLMPG